MNKHYAEVAHRAGHRCDYCRAPEFIFNLPFEVEHIVPTSREGRDDESNLALACRACNLADLLRGSDATPRRQPLGSTIGRESGSHRGCKRSMARGENCA